MINILLSIALIGIFINQLKQNPEANFINTILYILSLMPIFIVLLINNI